MSTRTFATSLLASLAVATLAFAAPPTTPPAGGARTAPASAPATAPPARRPARPATRPASGTRPAPADAHVGASTRPISARASAPPAHPAAAGAAGAAGRTLDDIHIEGEIAVPQVLFITARDQRRFMDFHHHRYLRSSQQLGEATVLPSRIAFTPHPTQDVRKESSR